MSQELASDQIAIAAFWEAPVPTAIVEDAEPPVFVRANRAFCELVGHAQDALAVLHPAAVVGGLDQLIEALDGDAAAPSVEGNCHTASGSNVPVILQGSLLASSEGRRVAVVQVVELTARRAVERALRESEQRVQDLVDNVGALIYIKSADGRFLLVNRHFEKIFGVSRQEAPERTNYDFFPPEVAAIYSANDRRVLETGVSMEFEEPRAEGGAWLSLKFPLFDDEGSIYAVGGISTDITDRSRAEAAIRQARDEAERANRAKSEFLSRMSHELRTPLNSILGFGQLLQLEQLPRGSRESVDRIVKAGRHLLALINEVLEISRIEAGAAPSTVEPVHACLPLTEALDLVRPLAAEREIEIVQDMHAGLYQFVLADHQRLKQVLLNILSNAIKYNRLGGRVVVDFSRLPDGRLRFRVADTGYGMDPGDVDKAFLPFDRLGADRTRTEGTGLGLALSRSLVEAMGGTIGVERTVRGEGTTFFVDLAVAENPHLEPEKLVGRSLDPADSQVTLGVGKILYIEDNLSNLDLVQGLFARVAKVRMIPAVQGQLGIELATRHRPDLILLDLHLPDLDGDEVLKRLHGDERTRDIPVIVLSADATPAQVARLKRLGALEYLTKPIDVPLFIEAVRRALDKAA